MTAGMGRSRGTRTRTRKGSSGGVVAVAVAVATALAGLLAWASPAGASPTPLSGQPQSGPQTKAPTGAPWKHPLAPNGTNANFAPLCQTQEFDSFRTCHASTVKSFDPVVSALQSLLVSQAGNRVAVAAAIKSFWCSSSVALIANLSLCIPVCTLPSAVQGLGPQHGYIMEPAMDFCHLAQNRTKVQQVLNNTVPNLETITASYGCPVTCSGVVDSSFSKSISVFEVTNAEPAKPVFGSSSGGSEAANSIVVMSFVALASVLTALR